MNRNISIICSLLLALALGGCYKDEGNYSYHAINDITITTATDTFRVNKFDTLQITPTISQAKSSDESHLQYEWSVYLEAVDLNEPAHNNIVVLSTQRNLDIQVALNAESAGPYNLNYKVTDTLTGVSYYKHLILYVSTALQNGWLLLEHLSDHSDISFITSKQVTYHNIFSAANPDKILPLSAKAMTSVNIPMGGIGVLNFVLDDQDGWYMDKTSLQALKSYSQFFYGAPAALAPGCIQWQSFLATLYTVNNGQVYGMQAISGATLFGAAFQQPDAKGATIAPFVAGGFSYGGIFFDQRNYRFLNDGNSTSLATFPADNTMAFDMNNVHKTLLTMKQGVGGNYFAVFRNLDNDSTFLYELAPNGSIVAVAQQPILNSPGISTSVDWQFSPTLKQLYYAQGNQLYVYDMVANQSRVVYQFAAGQQITALQLRSNTLVVATYTGTAGGGAVYYLPLSTTGDVQGGAYSQLFTGFEKIVYMTYKVG
ncbi:MAG TPA: PKD-like family lipoprotein [Chitinophaga sp.]